MKGRERLIAITVGAFVGLFTLYLAVNGLVLSPARQKNQQIVQLQDSISKYRREVDREAYLVSHVKKIAGRTFGFDDLSAGEQFRERIMVLLKTSNLSGDVKRVVVPPVVNTFKEVRWQIAIPGAKLPDVVQFLLLLRSESYLSRLENVRFTPNIQTDSVKVDLQFATIVLDIPNASKLAVTTRSAAESQPAILAGLDRRPFDGIVTRNLFRPYVQRPPEPPAVVAQPVFAPPASPAAEPPSDARYRITSLTEWAGSPEVWVTDAYTGKVAIHKVGDALAGGRIVMVDYRSLPSPDDPTLLSPSRVIIKQGPRLWAVELKQTLAQKRLLSRGDVPPGLRGADPSPGTKPGATSWPARDETVN